MKELLLRGIPKRQL